MKARPMTIAAVLAATLAPPCAAQTLWTSPHGPGMRGLSPATVAAQPALKWKLLLPQGIGHGGVTFSDGGKFLYFKTYGPEQGRVCKVETATGRLLWTSPVPFGRLNQSGISVDDTAKRLYTAGNQTSLPGHEAFVACLDRTTGKPIWRTPVLKMAGMDAKFGDGNVLLSPDRRRLYVHDGVGHVAALDASNGHLAWLTEFARPTPTAFAETAQTVGPAWKDPTTHRTRFVVCARVEADNVGCLQDNGASASLVWKASPANGMKYRWWGHASASIDGSCLYLNGFNTFPDAGNPVMACLDAATGATKWVVGSPGGTRMDLYTTPCVGRDGIIYASGFLDRPSNSGGIVAYHPDGSVNWTLDTKGGEANGWPAATAGGSIYVMDQQFSKQPDLLAVRDLGDRGVLLWKVRLPYSDNGIGSPVPGPDGTVYITGNGRGWRGAYLYAFAPVGAVRVERLASGVAPVPPAPHLIPLQFGPIPAGRMPRPLPEPDGPPVLMPQLHQSFIRSITLSSDGNYLATAGGDNTAQLWEVSSGKEIRRFEGHSRPVNSVALSSDGRYLATASDDGTARLWDAATGRLARSFGGHSGPVVSIDLSPDGRYIATGSDDNTARLWDAATGKEVRRFDGHAYPVHCIAFSPDGRNLATGGGITAQLWNAASGREVRRFKGHSGTIWAIAFSPDGRHLATGSADGTVRMWDAASGRELRHLDGHSDTVRSVAFSPDARYLASAGEDNTARIWDAATGKEVRRFDGDSSAMYSVAFSPDGRCIATGGGKDTTTRLWSIAAQREVRRFEGDAAIVTSVAFSPDGRRLAAGSSSGDARLWSTVTGKAERRVEGHFDWVTSVAFSHDGRYLATGSDDKTARLWDPATAKELRRFEGPADWIRSVAEGHRDWVYSVAFSPDGRYLAIASDDNITRLWDAETAKELRRFEGHTGSVWSVAFSPAGRLLATGSADKTARLWDIATGRELGRFDGAADWVRSVAFSPDGRFLAAGSADSSACIWEVSSGNQVCRLEGHSAEVRSVAFSPNGRYVGTGALDGTARLWDAATGQEVRRFVGHAAWIESVAFSPDGRYLATGSIMGSTGIWDTATGNELCQMVSFEDGTWAVVDPEGRYDASSDDLDGVVWVVGNETITLPQLKERYYEPGLLAKVLGYNKEPLRNVTAFKDVALPPTLQVLPPGKGSSSVRVKVTARSGGIGRVALSVNGSEFLTDARPLKLSPKAPRATLTGDLTYAATLKPGTVNSITAVAYTDTEPRISSRTASVSWKAPGSALSGKPRFYGLVAGVSDYAGTALDLKYAGKDAVDVYTTLKMAADRLFLPENVDVRLLTTADHAGALKPTKANLEKVMADFRKSRTGDTVFLYLAGHGITLKQGLDTYCYLTQEARSAEGVLVDPAVRKQASVTSNELAEWLKKVPALKRVIVLDTCAAGSAGDVLTEKREVPGDQLRAMALLHGRVGTQVLMGCAADAVSYEATRYGQGLLTYAILDGVRGAALQNDQFVDVGTLFNYVSDAVPKLAGGLGGIQKPEFRSRGQAFAVGRMLPEDKVKVPIGAERPLVLRPIFQEQDTGDRLRLAALVRDKIVELDWAGTRSGTVGPGIAYVDADEMPGALRPRAIYTVEGTNVSVHLVIWQDDRKLRTEDISGTTDQVNDIVSTIVEAIRSAWKPTGSAPKANTLDK